MDTLKDIIDDYKDVKFLNVGMAEQQSETYVDIETYLSGDLIYKLEHAQDAQEIMAKFGDNSLDINVHVLNRAINISQATSQTNTKKETKTMETNKNTQNTQNISAIVNPLKDQSGKVKAMASVTVDGIRIRNLTVVEGAHGPFVGYPQYKDKNGKYSDYVSFAKDKDGKLTEEAITLKKAITDTIVGLYKNGENRTPEQPDNSPQPSDPHIKIHTTPLRDSQTALKGIATIQIANALDINVVKINENSNTKQLFVGYPSVANAKADSGYSKIVAPVGKEFSAKIESAVLKSYSEQLSWQKNHDNKSQKQEQTQAQTQTKAKSKTKTTDKPNKPTMSGDSL